MYIYYQIASNLILLLTGTLSESPARLKCGPILLSCCHSLFGSQHPSTSLSQHHQDQIISSQAKVCTNPAKLAPISCIPACLPKTKALLRKLEV